MTTQSVKICSSCSRLKDGLMTFESPTRTCEAFPDGIPADILAGADHRSSRNGEVTWKLHPFRKQMLEQYEYMVRSRDAG